MKKFRIWNKQDKEMNYNNFIIYPNGTFLLENYIPSINETEDEIILMQSIELKDINDKEIYEGDIVFIKGKGEIDYYPSDDEIQVEDNYLVKRDSLYGVILKQTVNNETIEGGFIFNNDNFEVKVIGNIYENSDIEEGMNNENK